MNQNAMGSHQRGKVLLVDDDEIFRYAMALLLREEGWHVTESASGEDALRQVKTDRPDVVVLDQRMPDLTGTEVYQILKREGFEIPTLLVTAARDAEHLARSNGIPHFLCKPVDFDDLQRVLEKLAQGS